MKKAYTFMSLILTLVMLCSCGGYVKSYSATLLITSQINNEADIDFKTFKGTYNFKFRNNDATEHTLDIDASLGEGEMNIYIGAGDEKELLRTVKGGESCDEAIALDKYADEKSIYVILESNGKCVDGDFEFEYN